MENLTLTYNNQTYLVNSLSENNQKLVKNIVGRCEKNGYECKISIVTDIAIRSAECSTNYLHFAINGKTKETKDLALDFLWSKNIFTNHKKYNQPLRINTNLSWSPKPLYI